MTSHFITILVIFLYYIYRPIEEAKTTLEERKVKIEKSKKYLNQKSFKCSLPDSLLFVSDNEILNRSKHQLDLDEIPFVLVVLYNPNNKYNKNSRTFLQISINVILPRKNKL
ncbi:hypothetical protein L6164_033742 [Bauhinia variegata]|uniref:Uncharacterized protein n=1 Tax=Bauhinia variegata TaxID=167791 RepID=A0ACB9KSL4_BAUVA|nr:hypothetical protein L6164_033742 [Bauhinia variegata]